MSLINKIASKFSGKAETKLDKNIPTSYIIGLCADYGFMLIHGLVAKLFIGNCGSKLFLGRKTKLIVRKKMNFGSNVKIGRGCIINALSREGVIFGDGVRLGDNTIIECTGSLSNVGKGVVIGNRSGFGGNCFFGAAGGISIGDDVIAGQNIRFHSENHKIDDINTLIRLQGVTNKGIKVGNNCWIGAGAVFLDGAIVGDGCVIAANAVVTNEIPSNSIWGGGTSQVYFLENRVS